MLEKRWPISGPLSVSLLGTMNCKFTGEVTTNFQTVKDCGWYWGPITGRVAEAILDKEPNGSFVVRDSSDEHYIFSLTFKLDGLVRHVRIDHDHAVAVSRALMHLMASSIVSKLPPLALGCEWFEEAFRNFSFGALTKFKCNTIVDFIENAVQHSRSGRYLFFLHRRPVLGPMRVQLLHPVSRFKQVQSLQHMCRFVIMKMVRRDLVSSLPLPSRLKSYLDNSQYYLEELDNR